MNLLDLFVKISVDSGDVNNQIEEIGENANRLGGKFTNAAKKVAEFGAKAIAAASVAATAVGKYAIDVGSNFDSSMANVAAISGATGESLDALRDKAKEMGAKTKFSASESADAFTYMAMAGWKTEEMLNGIDGIMNLAAASGEDLALTSDIVTDALTAFGLQASDSAHFADVLAAASNSANTNVSMLGGSFKYVAPVAGALGYSIEDVSVALGLMANSGIKAEQAGTSMRAMLSRLAKPTKEVANAFESLGMDASEAIQNADGTMKPFSETMQILRDKMAGLSEAEKANMAAAIAGQEAMSGMLAIVNASDSDFEKLTSAIANADGTAQSMADTMINNLNGAITILKSATEGFGITLYETFSGPAQKAIETLTGYVSQLTDAFSTGGLSGLMDEMGNVVGDGLNKILEYLPKIVQVGADVVMALVNAIIQNLPALNAASIEIVLQLANGLIDNLPALIDALIQVTLTVIQQITDPEFLTQIVETAILLIMTLANGMIDAIPQLIAAVPLIIGNLLAAIIVELPNIIQMGIDLLFALIDGIIQCIPQLVAAVPTLIISFINGIVNNLDKIILAAPQIIVSLITGIVGAIPELIASVPRIIAAIADTIRNYDWGGIGRNIVQGLKDGIAGMWDNIKNWFNDKVDALVGGVKKILGIASPSKVFAGIGGFMAEGLGEGFDDQFKSVKEDIEGNMSFDAGTITADANISKNYASGSYGAESGSIDSGRIVMLLEQYLPMLANMKVIMDSGQVVGLLAPGMDEELAKINARRARAV
jgi:TP901 family phage tail tape measure protein